MEEFIKKRGRRTGFSQSLEVRLVLFLQKRGGKVEITRNVIARHLSTTPNTVGVTVSRLRQLGVIKPRTSNVLYELSPDYMGELVEEW